MSDERHETVADIVTEMRKRAEEVYVGQSGYPESWKDQMDYGEIYELADRIEAANKRENEATIEKSSAVGNAAAMREALLEASIALSDATHHHMIEDDAKECLSVVNAALSDPPRNCDVGTAEEQSDRFDKFCYSHSKCHKCPVKSIWNSQHRQKQLREIIRCEIIWSQMPYEGGGAE